VKNRFISEILTVTAAENTSGVSTQPIFKRQPHSPGVAHFMPPRILDRLRLGGWTERDQALFDTQMRAHAHEDI
jgi:hypothetical protein